MTEDEKTESIEELLALAGKEEDLLGEALTYVANLIMAYHTLSLMNEEAGNEYGQMVYGLVRDEVHAAFHLLLAHKEQLENKEAE